MCKIQLPKSYEKRVQLGSKNSDRFGQSFFFLFLAGLLPVWQLHLRARADLPAQQNCDGCRREHRPQVHPFLRLCPWLQRRLQQPALGHPSESARQVHIPLHSRPRNLVRPEQGRDGRRGGGQSRHEAVGGALQGQRPDPGLHGFQCHDYLPHDGLGSADGRAVLRGLDGSQISSANKNSNKSEIPKQPLPTLLNGCEVHSQPARSIQPALRCPLAGVVTNPKGAERLDRFRRLASFLLVFLFIFLLLLFLQSLLLLCSILQLNQLCLRLSRIGWLYSS